MCIQFNQLINLILNTRECRRRHVLQVIRFQVRLYHHEVLLDQFVRVVLADRLVQAIRLHLHDLYVLFHQVYLQVQFV